MINKQNLWFVTLFSLVLILGIYYVSIDDEVVSVLKADNTNTKEVIEINDTDSLVALEVDKDEEKQALMEEYQNVLLDSESTLQEKNTAYEKMQKLNSSNSDEEKIKVKLKEKYNIETFVKINDNKINITVASNDHNAEKANNIIRTTQELFTEEKYITVKYQK